MQGTLPWTRSCFVCGENNPDGLRQRSRIENNIVVLDYITRPTDVGYRHIVHGGIAMTLLDEVMTWAAIIATRKICVAAEITIRLRHPIEKNQPIRVEGEAKETKSRICYTEGRILDSNRNILLKATGKYTPMPEDGVTLCEEDFVHAPESIPLHELFNRRDETTH